VKSYQLGRCEPASFLAAIGCTKFPQKLGLAIRREFFYGLVRAKTMARFCCFCFLLIAATGAHAGGYGWYAYSFDWEEFSKELATIDARLEKANLSEWDSPSRHLFPTNVQRLAQKQDAYDQLLKEQILREEEWGTFAVNESPMTFEFYWPKAFHFALSKSSAKDASYFRFFERGRPFRLFYDPMVCEHKWQDEWGYCYDAYFILNPKEVREFERELTSLRTRVPIPDEYAMFLEHLDGVLKKAAAEGVRGLYFEGHE
jgi:hypothetical protein